MDVGSTVDAVEAVDAKIGEKVFGVPDKCDRIVV